MSSPKSEVDSSAPTLLSGQKSDARPVDPIRDDTFERERYTARRVIGAGGMGEVRLCSDGWIGRDVAMKVAHPPRAGGAGGSAAETRGRFLREARVQGQLEHPSVVPVYDIGKLGDEAFFTMKRIGGHTLEEVVSGLREETPEICAKYNRRKLLSAMSQVCLAIAYAHSRGVIHRDLKPANVMLGDFGEVYVLDWGVAKLTNTEDQPAAKAAPVDTGDPAVTQAGAIIGTPGYMPPEQLRGELVTPQSDVYALGAILFELLALEPLNTGRTIEELMAATFTKQTPPSVRTKAANVPPELDAIVVRATAQNPAERFTARSMQESIEAFLDGERDAERRRELASVHVKNARDALERASKKSGLDADADRAEGMRELGRAVALDPSDVGALRSISELVLAPAGDLPPRALEELAAGERKDRAKGAIRAARMYIVWLGLVPLLWVMGVRSWSAIAVLVVLIILSSANAQRIGMSPDRAVAKRLFSAMLLNFALVASVSCIFGPLIFVPGIAASSAASFVIAVREKSWLRSAPFVFAMLAVLVPLALEQLDVLPRAYTFDHGVITVHPFVASFVAMPTLVSLTIVTFVQLMLPAVLLNRAIDALVDAERRSFAQAWRLRQLLPRESR
jgi:serine/threonine protein kinase